jgi:heme exporter protein A
MTRATATSDPREIAHLAVRGLACRRGERVLFGAVDFTVRPGEIVWLRGANGQGKTTLLRTLAGLSAPEAGTVVWGASSASRPFIYIAHANALKEDLSATESLRFLIRLSGGEASGDDLDAALARFDLASRRNAPVRTLSQGQRRRVALARLAAEREASTWLLDEPFDALDAAGIETLNAILVAHARRGGSIVLTSHVPLAIEDPAPFIVGLESPVAAP